MSVIKIKPNYGSVRKAKRVGRGTGSGKGKQCGRGGKGQTARTGSSIRPGFEGGQMPLYRRLPKRGFKNSSKVYANLVNVSILNAFAEGETVNRETLLAKGLIKEDGQPIKLLANGDLQVKKLKVIVDSASESAKQKVEKSGGSVELVK
jgi:large subunit ribosomal protein L15